MYATQTPVAQAVAEFQLIEDKNGFILGRLFIPAGVHGCVKGSLVRKVTWGKSTVIEFVPRDVAEVERCYKQYAASNMAGNRVRTVGLLNAIRAGRPICPQEEVFTPEVIADPWDGVVQSAAIATPAVERVVYLLPPAPEVEMNSCHITLAEVEDGWEYMSVRELKAIAHEWGLKGYSKMKKAQLLDFLFANNPSRERIIDAGYDLLSDEEKAAYCKSIGIV